ncbi:hypothetical protein [Cohnella abietis]|uniref:Serine/threonine protein kinase n=1 Tax=Cohnella abietis TaxID=2507935 RepID=A0A3T1CZR1_9BACL|nr:hypothetical protein [Cohnella abietis]BBI31330.1 hypothetical protein KCTCHS21_07290 [Cohnella abietis]
MKKYLTKVLLLSLTLVFCIAASNANMNVTKDLPLLDDRGGNWVLKNAKEFDLKWSIQDDSPYQKFELDKGPNGLVYVQSFNHLSAIDSSTGETVWKKSSEWKGSNQNEVGLDGSVYKFDYGNSKKINSKTIQLNITRYSSEGVVTTFKNIKASSPNGVQWSHYSQTIHAANSNGDFTILTDKGLLSLKPNGSKKWLLSSLNTVKGKLNLMDLKDIYADNKGNIVIKFEKELASINADGKVNWVRPYKLNNNKGVYSITQNGYFLEVIHEVNSQAYTPKLYSITSKGLIAVKDVSVINKELNNSDKNGGLYQLEDNTNELTNLDYFKGNAKWVYGLTKSEKQGGHELYNGSLTTDSQGNAYFGSNVGTVYSLDNKGKPRFTIKMRNGIIAFPDIVAISDKLIVVTVNNQIACIEKIGK